MSLGSNISASIPEIDGIRDQLISSANTAVGGRYIFGGSVTTTPPYTKAPNSVVSYNGNANATTLQVGRNATLQTQVPGSDIFSGTIDIFATMSDLLTAMQAGDRDAIATQAQKLEQFSDTVSTVRSRIGGFLNVADNLSSQLTTAGLSRAQELNDVQSADPAQAITQLTLSQTNFQATLAVGARIAQMSLLDYLH